MILLQRFPADADLTSITQSLWQHKIPHRVRFVSGEQHLWLQNAAQKEAAQALCLQVLQGNAAADVPTSRLPSQIQQSLKLWVTVTPITLMVCLVILVVTLISQLGEDLETVAWFSFFPLVFDTQIYMVTGFDHLWQQPWRLITPILLHFGWLHLVFNLLWWLDLGRRIERHSRWVLLGLLLLTGLAGNVAQAWQGVSLFGGLSGVIYGLLSYIWVIDRYNPPRYHLPQGILIFMLLWLLLGISGLFSAIGFGAMANMAHLGGLVAGVLWALLHSVWLRIRPLHG